MLKKIIMGLMFVSVMYAQIDKELVRKYLPDNPVIVDAGAHDGRSSMALRETWPDATIHSFEPVPELFDQLINRTRSFSNIFQYNLALGNKVGSQTLFISKGRGDGSSSLLKPTGHLYHFPDVTFSKSVEVRVETIDSWAKNHNVLKVDLLWLDMQGVEHQVLKASPEILKTVKAIFTEVNMTSLYQDCSLYSELKSFLEQEGFVEICRQMAHHTFGDSLFIRKELV